MNILVLTKHKKGRIPERLHVTFLLGLQRFGHKIEIIYQIDRLKLNAKALVDQHKPDILLCYTSYGIRSHQIQDLNCCKVIVETDFYKKVRDNQLGWYKDCGFDLVIQRNAYDVTLDIGIPMIWLPFSADPKEFYSDLTTKREPIVAFAGSYTATIYSQRRKAIEKLKKAGIYREYAKSKLKYPNYLRRSLMWLTSTEIGSPHGKMFEAIASGTIVLTSPFLGEKSLFGNRICYARYKDNCSDIVEQAKKIINDPKYAKVIRNNALDVFHQFHTHKKRQEELNDHLLNVFHKRAANIFWHPE